MPRTDVEKFVDAVFARNPKEAPTMAQMAAAGEMGFGSDAADYGRVEDKDGKRHERF